MIKNHIFYSHWFTSFYRILRGRGARNVGRELGLPVLTVNAEGELRCTSCMLCVAHCPAKCIKVEVTNAENSRPKIFEIDALKCIFCGLCEEACPVDAIRMGVEKSMPIKSKNDSMLDIAFLAHRESLPEYNLSNLPSRNVEES